MAEKNIVIVLGSPRKNGNSTALAEQVAAGAEAGGANVETFYLHGMNLSPCSACGACESEADKDCIIDDPMKEIYPKLRAADALVIATPTYWFNMSA